MHESHLGIEKSRSRARDIMFWPRMSQDIENLISKCAVCQESRNRNQKEPLHPHEVPTHPWSKLAADIFQFENEQYLLIVDYYSEFFEISKLSDMKSSTVITHCKSQFSRHGIPDVFMSDCARQFDSAEMRKFAADYGFQLKTSSPTYPQSNGMAEKAVQTAKRLLSKAKQDGRDPYLALLDYRNTPRDKELGSPVQRLMGRRTKTTLPTSEILLKLKLVRNVRSNLKEKRLKQKYFYDKSARTLPPIHVGDDVRIRRGKYWEHGHVTEQSNAPRSFLVQSRGQMYRRNRRDLLKTRETFPNYMYTPFRETVDTLPSPQSENTTTTTEPTTDTPQPAQPQPMQAQPKMTSSGRVVKTPGYLKDYVTK